MADKRDDQQATKPEKDKKSDDKNSEAAIDESDTSVRVEVEGDDREPAAVPIEEPTEEEQLRSRVAELEDKLLRTAAEFENRKKRLERQTDDMIRMANDRLIGQLLDVVDNFRRALDHGDENQKSFQQGIELIFNQLQEMLEKYEIKPIEAIGQPFDPSVHEALMQVDSEEYNEGVVALEISRGYKAGDRVLRYAKVGVSKGKPTSTGGNGADTDSNSEDDN